MDNNQNLDELARFFRRPPWRGHEIEATEQRAADLAVRGILERQWAREDREAEYASQR